MSQDVGLHKFLCSIIRYYEIVTMVTHTCTLMGEAVYPSTGTNYTASNHHCLILIVITFKQTISDHISDH